MTQSRKLYLCSRRGHSQSRSACRAPCKGSARGGRRRQSPGRRPRRRNSGSRQVSCASSCCCRRRRHRRRSRRPTSVRRTSARERGSSPRRRRRRRAGLGPRAGQATGAALRARGRQTGPRPRTRTRTRASALCRPQRHQRRGSSLAHGLAGRRRARGACRRARARTTAVSWAGPGPARLPPDSRPGRALGRPGRAELAPASVLWAAECGSRRGCRRRDGQRRCGTRVRARR